MPVAAPCLCFDAAHRGPGRIEVCVCGIDGRLFHRHCVSKRLLVQFNKNISLVYAVVVIHQNPGDLTADAGGDERHMAVHEGVVGRNRAEREPDPGNTEHQGDHQDQNTQSAHQPSSSDRGALLHRWNRPGSRVCLRQFVVTMDRGIRFGSRGFIGRP